MCALILQRSCCKRKEKQKTKWPDRSFGQFDQILVNLIWDGCLQQGAASGCNRHREQNNRCTLINRVKLYSVRVRDITFWHQSSLALLDIHSSLLEYYFRILNTERISPPRPLHSFQRVKRLRYRGAWFWVTTTALQLSTDRSCLRKVKLRWECWQTVATLQIQTVLPM